MKTQAEALATLKKVCDDSGIPIILLFGTLLGAYRDHDFIPGDTDLDLGIYETDVPKLKALIPTLAEHHITLTEIGHSNFMFDVKSLDLRIDLWTLTKKRTSWICDHAKLSPHHFDTLETITLHHHVYAIPKDPEALLATWYGPTWRIPQKGVHAVYRARFSRFLTWLFFTSKNPSQFSGNKTDLTFRPWASKLLKTLAPNAKLTQDYEHPQ